MIFNQLGFVNIIIVSILISFLLPTPIISPILIGLLFLYLISRFIIKKGEFQKRNFNKVSLFFALYFFSLVISLFYSENLDFGFKRVEKSIVFIVLPLIPMFIKREEIKIRFIALIYLKFLCLLLLFLLFFSFCRNIEQGYNIQYFIDGFKGVDIPDGKYRFINYWEFTYEKFTQPIKLQPIYCALFVNIGLVGLFFLKRSLQRRQFYVYYFLLLLFIILCGSRWQLMICVLNSGLYIFFLTKVKTYLKWIGLSVIITFITVMTIVNPVSRVRMKEAFSFKSEYYNDQFGGASLRIKKWKSAIKVINRSPIIGYGIGDGKSELLRQYKKDKFYLGYYFKFNSHNQYLDTLLFTGLIGLSLLLAIFFASYFYSKKCFYLFLITNIYSIGFVTESMLNRQWGVISFSFILILLSHYIDEEPKD